MDFWNRFDLFTMTLSFLHMLVPIYTIALSSYQAPIAQFIIYYFSSLITTIATILLSLEAALLCLGLIAQGLSDSQSMGIFTGNLVSNIIVIIAPFAGITAYL